MLLSKLSCFNLSDQAVSWFQSDLPHREQCAVVDGSRSAYMGYPVGVPQGSILGPILFSLYINNLPDHRLHVDIWFYADDTVIFTEVKNPEEAARVLSSHKHGVIDHVL